MGLNSILYYLFADIISTPVFRKDHTRSPVEQGIEPGSSGSQVSTLTTQAVENITFHLSHWFQYSPSSASHMPGLEVFLNSQTISFSLHLFLDIGPSTPKLLFV